MTKLTEKQRAEARQVFEAKGQCSDCGGLHARACPRVKRFRERYSESTGTHNQELLEREVEYWDHGHWPATDVIWPEDVYEEDDELEHE